MAPTTPLTVEWQTNQIIKYLFEDDDDLQCRTFNADLEVDSPQTQSDEDTFDPVIIADKLRSVADSMNADVKFKAALADLKKVVATEAFETAFSRGVDAICQSQVSQQAEVVSEMQLIRASMFLGFYVMKSAPELKMKIQSVMSAFLTRRVGPYVTQEGGWDKVV